MLMEVLPRSSCWRGGVGRDRGHGAGARFLGPVVGSEARCSALALDCWNCVHLCAPEFGYLCSDPMTETSWILNHNRESANWTISPSVPILSPPNSTSSSQT